MKRIIYTFLISLVFSGSLFAQSTWIVPEDQSNKLARFEFNESTEQSGSELYLLNCKSCHGMPGEANFAPLNPPPGDPADSKIQGNTDGGIYYKVREGKGLMPSFKKILSVKQTWDVISYLRSSNTEYVQEVAIASASNRWEDITIQMEILEHDKKLKAIVSGLEGAVITPVAGVELRLEAERRFGKLQLGDLVTTNKDGIAYFDAPYDLPGDPEGNLNLTVQLDNEDDFGLVNIDTTMKAGLAFTPVSLTAKRAMWNTMRKAPIWLLLTYGIGVLAAWGIIFFVMFQLRTIFKLGKQEEEHQA